MSRHRRVRNMSYGEGTSQTKAVTYISYLARGVPPSARVRNEVAKVHVAKWLCFSFLFNIYDKLQ